MPDYDAGFKIAARESGREIAELGGVHCDTWEPITGEVHAAERLADRAFRASYLGEDFLVYMEAYTRWEAKAPWSILAKSGLLSERERLPCVSLAYILLPHGYHPQDGTFRLTVEGRTTQQVWFREICLWELEPQRSWEAAPGLMALYPLLRHGGPPVHAIEHAADSIRSRSPDIIRRADLLTVLAVFGKLAIPGFDSLSVIGRTAMKESPLYQEIMAEGGAIAHRQDILDLLRARFGSRSAKALLPTLEQVHSLTDLTELFQKALRCRTVGGFRKLLSHKAKAHHVGPN